MNYRKALIINLGGIGDLVISTAFFRNFKKNFPECRVTALIPARSAEVLNGLEYIDEIIAYDLQAVSFSDMALAPGKIFDSISHLLRLRKEGYDIAVNLLPLTSRTSALKMAAVFFLIGAKINAGRDTNALGCFYHLKVRESLPSDIYDVERQAMLLEALGGVSSDKSLDVSISPDDAIYIDKMLLENGIGKDVSLIIVNPGSNWPSKKWPLQNFIRTIKGLKSSTNASFVISGSESEVPLAEALRNEIDDVFVAAGKTTLPQLAALLKRASLFITNDTGPMHLAAAVGTPVVAIFGPGHYKRFFTPGGEGLIRKDYKCSPCVKSECEDMGCLKAITPDEVIEKALWLLSKK